jgi:transporter family-2 protein
MPIKYYLWAALAGAFIPVMAVLNARLGASLGESMHAPVVLFSVGVVATVASAFFVSGSLPSPQLFPRVAWVDLLGGFIVAFYVISATLLAPRIGVSNFIMFAVSSQVVLSVVIDHFGLLGAEPRPLDFTRMLGAALLIVGLVTSQISSE